MTRRGVQEARGLALRFMGAANVVLLTTVIHRCRTNSENTVPFRFLRMI